MRRLELALLVLALAGCRSAVLTPVPEPLPEALPWSSTRMAGAFLGLQTRENDSGSLEDLFFSPGVRVVRVIENSPAAGAGIEPGDVLLRLDGEPVNDPDSLSGMLAGRTGGERVELHVRRGDSVFELVIELVPASAGATREPELLYRLDPSRSAAGWATDVGGVRLVSAGRDSPVLDAGLPLGSLVTALDGERVHSDRALIRRLVALAPGSSVEFDFVRPDGASDRKTVELLEAPTYTAGFHVPILVHYSHDADRETTDFSFLDLWVISLFEYHREANERRWSLLRFISYSSGEGELSNR